MYKVCFLDDCNGMLFDSCDFPDLVLFVSWMVFFFLTHFLLLNSTGISYFCPFLLIYCFSLLGLTTFLKNFRSMSTCFEVRV